MARAGAVSHERLADLVEVRGPIEPVAVPGQHLERHACAVQLVGPGLDPVLQAVVLRLRATPFGEGDELDVGEGDPALADELVDQPDGFSESGKRHLEVRVHPIGRDRQTLELPPAGAVLDAGNHQHVSPGFGEHMLDPALQPCGKGRPIEQLRIGPDGVHHIKGRVIRHCQQLLLEPIEMVGIRHGTGPDDTGILRSTHQLSRLLFGRLLWRHRPAITGPVFLEQVHAVDRQGGNQCRLYFAPPKPPLSTGFPHVHHTRLLAETEFSQRIQNGVPVHTIHG